MPGPNSTPKARDPRTGRIVSGKTALRLAGLKSREHMAPRDYVIAEYQALGVGR